ncbi:MAG: hypothetical protein LBU27_01960 [Candidatus Peribacteria bacterium]|nr:hypothetical protein [Candidatus Peribacteria bacterium]
MLPLIQRKLLISKAGANELFILSENGDAQHLNYLIQRVFIENSLLYVEKLYSYFILQPSFKTDNLSEIEKQELCKKQFFDDTTNISADVQRNNVILNPLNHFLDEKDSIRLCVEFYDFYSKN